MKTIDELLTVLVITAIGVCVGFGIFLYNHDKEHKKEVREKSLREAGNNKGSVRQPDKSVHDEPSGTSTTPASSTTPTETSRSI